MSKETEVYIDEDVLNDVVDFTHSWLKGMERKDYLEYFDTLTVSISGSKEAGTCRVNFDLRPGVHVKKGERDE